MSNGSITPWVNYKGDSKPEYQTPASAGADLTSTEDVVIPPGEWRVVPTGLFLELANNFYAQVCPRSGLAAKHGVTVLNAPGIIDCFAEDSLISTLSGKKKVHDISINEAVLSFNEATQEIQKDIVSAIVDVGIKDVLIFTFEDGSTISVTPGTLVYTADGLKAARDITGEDRILFDHDI